MTRRNLMRADAVDKKFMTRAYRPFLEDDNLILSSFSSSTIKKIDLLSFIHFTHTMPRIC